MCDKILESLEGPILVKIKFKFALMIPWDNEKGGGGGSDFPLLKIDWRIQWENSLPSENVCCVVRSFTH